MKSLHKLSIAVVILGAGGLLYAQPADPTEPTDSVTVNGAKAGSMSPAEMTVSAQQMITDMHGMLRHVTQLREKAGREKDIIKLNCVDDKLMPLKAQVNLGEEAHHQLEAVIGSGDDSARYAAYSDLVVSNGRSRDLRDAADACVGDALTYIGTTDVQVTGPTNPVVPGESIGIGNTIEPPVYKTPFD